MYPCAQAQCSTLDQGPAATVDVARKVIGEEKVRENDGELVGSEKAEKNVEEGVSSALGVEQAHKVDENETQAEVAAEVADSAQKLDKGISA